MKNVDVLGLHGKIRVLEGQGGGGRVTKKQYMGGLPKKRGLLILYALSPDVIQTIVPESPIHSDMTLSIPADSL